MARIVEVQTTVLPGHRIELQSLELPIGQPVTVSIRIEEEAPPRRRLSEILADYPGGQLFRSAEEVDAYLRAEREAWDS